MNAGGVVAVLSALGAIFVTIFNWLHSRGDVKVVETLSKVNEKAIETAGDVARRASGDLAETRKLLERNFERLERAMRDITHQS